MTNNMLNYICLLILCFEMNITLLFNTSEILS